MTAPMSSANEVTEEFASADTAARLMIVARLNGDGRLAGEIARSFAATDPDAAMRLALVAVDLAAGAHTWWAKAVFPDWPGELVVEAWEQVTRQLEAQADGG